MLPYALGTGAAVLVVLVVRHLTGHRAPVLIALTAVLLAVGGWFEYRWDAAEADYTAALRSLIQRSDVEVDCQRLTGTFFDASAHSGWVAYPQHGRARIAQLKYEVCSDLADWRSGGSRADAPLEQIEAVHVLTHEAMHLAGWTDEATAECYAMQLDARTAQLLGASETAGARLAARYYREAYPLMPPDYRSGRCVPGGELDLRPDTDSWPTG